MDPTQEHRDLTSAVLDQLDGGYNLARWLVGNDQDARDVVQESCLKALRNLETFRDGDFRAWFMTIIRNTSFTLLSRRKGTLGTIPSLETDAPLAADSQVYDPQQIALRAADALRVRQAIETLPEALRQVVILREMEQLSYKEIGKAVGIPIGTVMSRLARARMQLQALLAEGDSTPPPAVDTGRVP